MACQLLSKLQMDLLFTERTFCKEFNVYHSFNIFLISSKNDTFIYAP